jgi:PII-like signaling protein
MLQEKEAQLLRIFIGENDKIGPINVYEKIVVRARECQLAGATVYKGIMGFGGTSVIHTSKVLRLSEDLPLVIEIVDSKEKIQDFLPELDKVLEKSKCGGLITIEKATIVKHFTPTN